MYLATAVQRIDPTKLLLAQALVGFFLTTPIFGVLLSSLFAGDPLTGALLLASVLVAIGIGLTSRR